MKIVVVEDEAPIREGMRKLLGKLDPSYHVVGTAEDGFTGLRVIEKEKPDLIFLDIQMPEMDGLTMLRKLREKGLLCHAVVLTAYSDFSYAKEAIELGIDSYLLKPVKIAEIKKILAQIQDQTMTESNQEELLNLDRVFLDAINGQLYLDETNKKNLKVKYHIDPDVVIGIVGIWLGDDYEEYNEEVYKKIQELNLERDKIFVQVVNLTGMKMIVIVSYNLGEESLYSYFQNLYIKELSSFVPKSTIYVGERCHGLESMQKTIGIMLGNLEWNLVLGNGVLINGEKLKSVRTAPFEYPEELDDKVEKALLENNVLEFRKSFERLKKDLREEMREPAVIKDVCMQYCWLIIRLAKQHRNKQNEVYAQSILRTVSQAVRWEEIWDILSRFTSEMLRNNGEEVQDLLVYQTFRIMEAEYTNGLKLEEVAEQLHVSPEHLSATFKKETGRTFSETIRGYRIEKVKDLLIHSNLKLTEIAKESGYTDAKYMSKVFKEEVGMLPKEYQKLKSVK